MATNVTTDPVAYMKQRLLMAEIDLNKTIERINNYNENVIPEKNKQAKETLEIRKAKRAARPEKYANKAPLPENPKVLVPLDIESTSEVIGLRKKIEAYEYFIDILTGNEPVKGKYTVADYRKILDNKIKDYTIKYKSAKTRLDRNRNKLVQKKIANPKKYGARPDLPLVNKEMVNAYRALGHYQKVLQLMTGVNPKQKTSKFSSRFRRNK